MIAVTILGMFFRPNEFHDWVPSQFENYIKKYHITFNETEIRCISVLYLDEILGKLKSQVISAYPITVKRRTFLQRFRVGLHDPDITSTMCKTANIFMKISGSCNTPDITYSIYHI